MFFNKRGQFYLIIAIVLSIAVFGVTSRANEIEEAILFEDFDDLTNNYIEESKYVVNNALEDKNDVTLELESFTQTYLKYSQQRNPDLELLYVYSDGANVKLVNHFDTAVVPIENNVPISGAGQPLDQNIQVNVGGKDFAYKVPVRAESFGAQWYSGSLPNNFDLSVGGFVHNFNLDGNNPELKVLINLPEGQAEYTYTGSEYEFLASPPVDDAIKQVKVLK